jgi:uncharacterized damage-inducible protein DinB
MEITSVSDFVRYVERVRSRTRRLAALTPPKEVEYRPRPGMFSPGDLIRHIAGTERYLFVENVLGRPSSYPGHAEELASGLDDSLDYLDRLHQESLDLLAGLTDKELQGRCTTVAGVEITVWKWLRAMVEHEIHHRGQLYVLLGLLGVPTPPLYGLTETQVRERSVTVP